jgi:hypothetical protein
MKCATCMTTLQILEKLCADVRALSEKDRAELRRRMLGDLLLARKPATECIQ